MTRDPARVLLGSAARLLPPHHQVWGRAMRAELAVIEPGPDRLRFAMSCTRVALTRPGTIAAIGGRAVVVGVVAYALTLASQLRNSTTRREVIAMVVILFAVSWLARRPTAFGPAGSTMSRTVRGTGFVLIAALVLLAVNGIRGASGVDGHEREDATGLLAVWTTMLTIYTIALVRVTAGRSAVARRALVNGTGVGAAVAAGWLALVLWRPEMPTSDTAEILAIGAAGIVAAFLTTLRRDDGQDLIAGLWASVVAAQLIGTAIDAVLPLSDRWVPTNAPPVFTIPAPHRLTDSIGVWLLGALVAAAICLTVRNLGSLTPAVRGPRAKIDKGAG